jgi:hypothetical protein
MTAVFQTRLKWVQRGALGLGVLGLLACFIGAPFRTREFYHGYLFGYLFWLGLSLGCLTVTMIHYLTGGRWGYPVRRFLEAGFSTLPLLLVLFIPIFIGLHDLYPWAQADVVSADKILQKRSPYMTPGWFIGRTVFWFLLWLGLAFLLRRWSREQDGTLDPEPSRRLRRLSGPALFLFPFSTSLAYVDWIMSLERDWYSQVFGVVVLAGQVMVALAFATILLRLFGGQEELAGTANKKVFHQLGNLLLAFVLFWSYVAFAQLLVIYAGNLPHEISWYLHRIAGSWKVIVAMVAFFHFFFPFILLLFRILKEESGYLAPIATSLLLAQMVTLFWMITPSFHPFGFTVTWFDFAAPIGVGGVWVAVFLLWLQRAPLLPANDPRMVEEVSYGTKD